MNFMELFRIVQSLPHAWRVQLRLPHNSMDIYRTLFQTIEKESNISRQLYWFIIECKTPSIQNSHLL